MNYLFIILFLVGLSVAIYFVARGLERYYDRHPDKVDRAFEINERRMWFK